MKMLRCYPNIPEIIYIMPKSKKERPSSTKGIAKGWNCKKTILKTRMAKDQRFYKKSMAGSTKASIYEQACLEIGTLKGNNSWPASEAAVKANERALDS